MTLRQRAPRSALQRLSDAARGMRTGPPGLIQNSSPLPAKTARTEPVRATGAGGDTLILTVSGTLTTSRTTVDWTGASVDESSGSSIALVGSDPTIQTAGVYAISLSLYQLTTLTGSGAWVDVALYDTLSTWGGSGSTTYFGPNVGGYQASIDGCFIAPVPAGSVVALDLKSDNLTTYTAQVAVVRLA